MNNDPIVAFLQNQWFRDPERMKAMRQRPPWSERPRHEWNATWLFFGCLTGRRLQAAFGEELCDRILWEEVSPEIGGKSSSAFPADKQYITTILDEHRPAVVLAFGKIAGDALSSMLQPDWTLIRGPHPAARHPTVVAELRAMRLALNL